LGATRLSQLSRELEELGRSQTLDSLAESKVNAAIAEFELLQQILATTQPLQKDTLENR